MPVTQRSPLPGSATWLACFTVIGTVLVARNAYLFTTRVYEDSDFAANTIAVLQARHFELLTGNYSRLGFYHPGPAFLYIEAGGEWLFRDVTGLVPTPWNGQLLAILLLNAALLAAVIAVFARDGGTAVAVGGLGTVLAFTVLHPLTVNSNWMPYVYFAPALLMLASAAAVAAGRVTSVPLLTLAAGLCVHGHAEFLFFAPVVVLVALGGLFAPHWRQPGAVLRASPGHWLGALVIALALAAPIAADTIRHWPGELAKYVDYGTRASSLHRTMASAAGYTLRFWWPGGPERGAHRPEHLVAAAVALELTLLAAWLARGCLHPGQRRLLLWSLVMALVMTVLFLYYAWHGIDQLAAAYEGYFYWSVPLLVLLAAAAAALGRTPAGGRLAIPALAVVTSVAAVAAVRVPLPPEPYGPGQYFGDPGIPRAVAVLRAASHGHEIIVDPGPTGWADAVGVIAYSDRTGVRACVQGQEWAVLFRSQSICTPAEVHAGTVFVFGNRRRPTPVRPLFTLGGSVVYPGR